MKPVFFISVSLSLLLPLTACAPSEATSPVEVNNLTLTRRGETWVDLSEYPFTLSPCSTEDYLVYNADTRQNYSLEGENILRLTINKNYHGSDLLVRTMDADDGEIHEYSIPVEEDLLKQVHLIDDISTATEVQDAISDRNMAVLPVLESAAGETVYYGSYDAEREEKCSKFMPSLSVDKDSYTNSAGKITNHAIVSYVPQKDFTTVGKTTYVGKDHGYYIETSKSGDHSFDSNLFVFQLDTTMPNEVLSGNFELKLVPTLSESFRTVIKDGNDSSWNDQYDSALSMVTYPTGRKEDYFLTNVHLGLMVANAQEPNPGDTDYVLKEDYGDIFYEARYGYQGVGKVNYDTPFLNAILATASSWLSGKMGTAGDVLDTLVSPFKFAGDISTVLKSQTLTFDSNLSTYTTYATNADGQISFYGKTIKQVSMRPQDPELSFDADGKSADNPVLFGPYTNDQSYVDFVVRTTRRTSDREHGGNRNTYYLSLEMNIVQDGRWGWWIFKGGELTNLLGGSETISVCREIGTIQSD